MVLEISKWSKTFKSQRMEASLTVPKKVSSYSESITSALSESAGLPTILFSCSLFQCISGLRDCRDINKSETKPANAFIITTRGSWFDIFHCCEFCLSLHIASALLGLR